MIEARLCRKQISAVHVEVASTIGFVKMNPSSYKGRITVKLYRINIVGFPYLPQLQIYHRLFAGCDTRCAALPAMRRKHNKTWSRYFTPAASNDLAHPQRLKEDAVPYPEIQPATTVQVLFGKYAGHLFPLLFNARRRQLQRGVTPAFCQFSDQASKTKGSSSPDTAKPGFLPLTWVWRNKTCLW